MCMPPDRWSLLVHMTWQHQNGLVCGFLTALITTTSSCISIGFKCKRRVKAHRKQAFSKPWRQWPFRRCRLQLLTRRCAIVRILDAHSSKPLILWRRIWRWSKRRFRNFTILTSLLVSKLNFYYWTSAICILSTSIKPIFNQ